MATTNISSGSVALNDMLKDYMPYKLLSDEIIKRDYFLSTVEKDQKWKGGELQVPFLGANASSLSFGSLTYETDIADDQFVRGTVSNYAELWGAMQFHQRDLDSLKGGESAFVDLIGDRIEVFAQTMKEALSMQLLNGAAIDTVANVPAADGSAGEIPVNRPELFQVGQKVLIAESGSTNLRDSGNATVGSEKAYYVIKIDLNLAYITVSATRGGAGADVDTDGVAANDPIYHDGCFVHGTGESNVFTSLPGQLLKSGEVSGSATGSADLFGVAKVNYPHLQAYNETGSSAFSDTIANKTALKKIFDVSTTVRRLGRGNPTEAIMSFKNLAQCMAELETSRQYQADVKNISAYGWQEIQVSGVKGSLKLVGIPEMSDSNVLVLDKSTMKLHSDGFIERRQAPDGKQFYEVRGNTGYKYIVDHRFYGDLVCSKPSANAIIHDCS